MKSLPGTYMLSPILGLSCIFGHFGSPHKGIRMIRSE